MVANSYPEKPVLKYFKTTVEMATVILYLKSLNIPTEVKRAAYIIFRIESNNGRSGVNHNYAGLQAEDRWDAKYDHLIEGTCVANENQTHLERRFLCFRTPKSFLDMFVDKLQVRGLYIGGTTYKIVKMKINDIKDLCTAYESSWVKGKAAKPTDEKIKNFQSMYSQAERLFN